LNNLSRNNPTAKRNSGVVIVISILALFIVVFAAGIVKASKRPSEDNFTSTFAVNRARAGTPNPDDAIIKMAMEEQALTEAKHIEEITSSGDTFAGSGSFILDVGQPALSKVAKTELTWLHVPPDVHVQWDNGRNGKTNLTIGWMKDFIERNQVCVETSPSINTKLERNIRLTQNEANAREELKNMMDNDDVVLIVKLKHYSVVMSYPERMFGGDPPGH